VPQALLKATRPDASAPKPKHVESIALSVGTFEAYASPHCDPYASLLHKTWSRLAEKDARSTAKAVYVLHRLLSSPKCCGPDELLGFGAAYTELAKSRSKKTETHYFDRKVVARGASAPAREPTSPRTDLK